MALLREPGGESIPVTRAVQLSTEDEFSLVLQSESDCYCYIIYQGSDGAVIVIHAGRLSAGRMLRTGPVALIPPPGTETFYLILLNEDDPGLSGAVAAFEKDGSRRNARNVLNEVMRLRSAASPLAENPDKPVLMGGSSRSLTPPEGVEYSGATSYVKTILIRH
ncbi:DUF4384 domain-containing protein [Breznakiella homolactica]|uniref:DUF4384 domain-containing protein n=1 Tax=Breznakiella homolactica TaxID=2798577 RepID=A0A7T7XRL6_9SPIR|nr:DUF4384 domain-containing protein [Breznakiella homolactica]QQO11167.1 DUF4384 domain-containing protein [Breznakiella homolactica]